MTFNEGNTLTDTAAFTPYTFHASVKPYVSFIFEYLFSGIYLWKLLNIQQEEEMDIFSDT